MGYCLKEVADICHCPGFGKVLEMEGISKSPLLIEIRITCQILQLKDYGRISCFLWENLLSCRI